MLGGTDVDPIHTHVTARQLPGGGGRGILGGAGWGEEGEWGGRSALQVLADQARLININVGRAYCRPFLVSRNQL